MIVYVCSFFYSSRRLHTSCALVTGVQTCALPIYLRKTGVAVDDLSTEKVQLRARGHKQVEQIAITHGRIVARFPVQIIGAEDPVDLRASLGLDLKLLRDLVVLIAEIGIVKGQIGRAHV